MASKTLDFGSTPVQVAPGSLHCPRDTPVPNALEFDSAAPVELPDGSDVTAATSASAPRTPPRTTHGRAREKTTPPSGETRAAKKRAQDGRPPAALRHGLSFPSTNISAPSTDPWNGFEIRASIVWRTPSNISGIQATKASINHYLKRFSQSFDRGCVVNSRETSECIEYVIGGIHGEAMSNEIMSRVVKKFQNALNNVSRSEVDQIRNCRFTVKMSQQRIYMRESDVLARIRGRPLPGFRIMTVAAPQPVAAPPASEKATGSVMPAPGMVALALGADIANLRAESDEAHITNDFRKFVDSAMFMLEAALSYMKGFTCRCGAEAVEAGVAGRSLTTTQQAPHSGNGGHDAGAPGAGQPRIR